LLIAQLINKLIYNVQKIYFIRPGFWAIKDAQELLLFGLILGVFSFFIAAVLCW
jgi:hypothetical protein